MRWHTRGRLVGAAAALVVGLSGCGGETVVTVAGVPPDPCDVAVKPAIEVLLAGPANHDPSSPAGFSVAGSSTAAAARQCTFRADTDRAGAEVVIRIGQDRASEFMAKIPKEHLTRIVIPAADEAYWHREGQAVFVRRGELLLGVHVVREDGLDRAAAIQDLTRSIAAELERSR